MKAFLLRLVSLGVCAFSGASPSHAQSNYEPYFFATFAGNGPGSADGTGRTARFDLPTGVAADTDGNVYVADFVNHTVRKITAAGAVTTLAGLANNPGSADGTGSAARFNGPRGVAVDSAGNVYVAEYDNHTIRKITSAGVVSTLAGLAGHTGSADGVGSAARFNSPSGVALDTNGNVYVSDRFNHTVRKITPAAAVSTLAGLAGSTGSDDGRGSDARFYFPSSVAVDTNGYVYVADRSNDTVRKITPGGVVNTLAGLAGILGSDDGAGSAARFNLPSGVAVDTGGNVYVADSRNNTIRKITADGVVTTLAGLGGSPGSNDGTGNAARFNGPRAVAVDTAGTVYVADYYNNSIRKVTSAGVVSTLAGLSSLGSADGMGSAARFNFPSGVAVDTNGNVFAADANNYTIRKVTSAGLVSTLAGLAGNSGSDDGTGSAARFYLPTGVATGTAGNLFVADSINHTIRKITSTGVVTTLAGLAGSPGSDDGSGSSARFSNPTGVTADSAGNVYVADTNNHTIRKISSAGLTTLAGSPGSSGSVDGMGNAARFYFPSGVAVNTAGEVYVADAFNHTIRKITSVGVVTTLAGVAGTSGSVDGMGSAARFNFPRGVAVDSSGNVYVADEGNDSIRKIISTGVVTTLAGLADNPGSADGLGSAVRFNVPESVAVDSAGKVYVADATNNTIRVGFPLLQLVNAVSRKTHGSAGSFDLDLPLSGEPGVECRSSSGNHTLLFTFANRVLSGSASLTTGIGVVSGSPTFAENTMTVSLTGVADVQRVTVTLSGVTDAFSQILPDTGVSVNMLVGDTNGNKTVNASDVVQVKGQSGVPVNISNFREDVTANGAINAADIYLVKLRSGATLP